MHITDDYFDEMEIDPIDEEGIELDRLEYIIQMSLIKLRRFMTSSAKREHERVLVLETLRQAAFRKAQLLLDPSVAEEPAMLQFEMQNVINSALKELGLAFHLHAEVASSTDSVVPMVLVNANKRKPRTNSYKCVQSMSGSIGPPSKPITGNYSSILENYFLH